MSLLLFIICYFILIRYVKFFRSLKVPKCEIFNCADFHDFYTIKSLQEGDFENSKISEKIYI